MAKERIRTPVTFYKPTARRVVVDTNVLVWSILRTNPLQLLTTPFLQFYIPKEAEAEIRQNADKFCRRLNISPAELMKRFNNLRQIGQIIVIRSGRYVRFRRLAEINLRDIDRTDWPFLALAKALRCPLWSSEKRLKRQKIVSVINADECLQYVRSLAQKAASSKLRRPRKIKKGEEVKPAKPLQKVFVWVPGRGIYESPNRVAFRQFWQRVVTACGLTGMSAEVRVPPNIKALAERILIAVERKQGLSQFGIPDHLMPRFIPLRSKTVSEASELWTREHEALGTILRSRQLGVEGGIETGVPVIVSQFKRAQKSLREWWRWGEGSILRRIFRY